MRRFHRVKIDLETAQLHKIEAAIPAREERRRRKKRVVENKGGVIYAEDARQMVQQRQVNGLARLRI